MKKALIVILIIIVANEIVQAGEQMQHHNIKIGYGGMFLGDGDLVGPTLDFEYTYRLNKYLGLSPRILFGTFNKPKENYVYYKIVFTNTFDLRITLTPLPDIFDRLSVNVGLSYRHMNGSQSNSYRKYDEDGNYKEYGILRKFPIYKDEDILGYTVGIDMKIINREKINVGTKASMHKYDGNYYRDIAWSVAAYLGFEL